MRACYVMLRYPVLSETFIRDEIGALLEAGHPVMTVSLEGGGGADVPLGLTRARSLWAITRVVSLFVRRPRRASAALASPCFTVGFRLKLLAAAEEARRRGVETVHAHFAYRNADAAELIGRVIGSGHSVTVHAHDIFVENDQLGRRLRSARTVVTVCEYNREHLVEWFPNVAPKTVVIPCSTRTTSTPDRSIASGVPVILSVGRLVEKKGFDDLITATASIQARCRLVIIGEGPMEERLLQLIADLRLAERVTMLGALDHESTLSWFERADVFCLACKVAGNGDRDSMPVVTKEAMAAGLPVVTTSEVGNPEMVADGESGLLVPPSDPGALADALNRLVSDPDLRAAMGRAGRKLVAERFDLRDQVVALARAIGPDARQYGSG